MRNALLLAMGGAVTAPAAAGTVTVTIPQLSVSEYHRPYVAVWLEPRGGGGIRTLALWYDVKKGGGEPGTKWLPELRAWWRRGGRSLSVPADGITGATRSPGQHRIVIPADVRAGDYVLNVEAARETGGRELVQVPLTVPDSRGRAAGSHELGAVVVSAR